MTYLVTIGDSHYFKMVFHSVRAAGDLYPDLPVVVYDWGFSAKQLDIFAQCFNVQSVRKWKFIQKPVPFKLNDHEWKLAQKPYCYMDFVNAYQGSFLFLDGDAYMVKQIPKLLCEDFSIGVTLRRPEDQIFERGRCRVINSGVFMLNDPGMVDKWIARMQKTKERFVEQTALTRMLYEDGIGGAFREFPCEVYNYYWIDTEIPETARILHLKGRGVKKRKGALQ